jgi:hypothetical protein
MMSKPYREELSNECVRFTNSLTRSFLNKNNGQQYRKKYVKNHTSRHYLKDGKNSQETIRNAIYRITSNKRRTYQRGIL